MWVAYDVTETVRTRQALQRSEGLFRHVFDDAPSGMALHDGEGRFLRVNRAFAGYLGRSGGELLWLRNQDVTHPEDRDADRADAVGLYEGRARRIERRKRFLHADGHSVLVDVRASLVDGPGESAYVLTHVVPVDHPVTDEVSGDVAST